MSVLPEHILQRMAPEDREKLGKAGKTASECHQIAVAKSEKELQSQIEAMLNREGIHVIRQRMDKRTTTAAGTPDLLFAISGKPTAWEIKMPGKNPTPEQLATMARMLANGWDCRVIRSYDDARREMNAQASDREGGAS